MDHHTVDINRVIKSAIDAMENSKYQIFEIYDSARRDLETLEKELQQVLEDTMATIDTVDKLEKDYQLARIRLTEVSRDFVRYQEKDIKAAYEKATGIQLELMVYREKETYLKARRDDLQMRARSVEISMERAEMVSSQINIVLEYLSGDLNQLTRMMESAKNRQMLGFKIIVAQEEERKRVAREIHDGPAQSLANIVLRTEIAERMLIKQEFEMVHEELIDLKHQVRLGLEEIRKIIFNLRPMALDDLGLVPALRKFTHDFEDKTRIHTAFEVIGKEIRLPSAMEAAVYRLVQEAFSNVNKHAEATKVNLDIIYGNEQLTISIVDNGKGFSNEAEAISGAKSNVHFGLIGMYERVELVEGRLEIDSNIGEGTKIIIIIPITADSRRE